jgi:hypothetical protein
MLTFYIGAVTLLAVVCAGGSLARLGSVRIRRPWLLWAALADQVIIISVLPDSHPALLAVAHLASYAAAGVCLVLNRRLPGAWLMGAGGGLNGLVIALNGGSLPASASAMRTAGRIETTEHFSNSGVHAHPRLALLGDVFATPAWLPGHTVFSAGDVLIWLGIAWLIWRTCRAGAGRQPVAGRHRLSRRERGLGRASI